MRIIPYVVGAILFFFCAKGIVYLYKHATGKISPWWVFPLAFFISPFLVMVLTFSLAILYAAGCGISVWIEEKWRPCKESPNGRHKWEEVEEDRTRRTDWGCIPGTYCVHCGKRRENKKKA